MGHAGKKSRQFWDWLGKSDLVYQMKDGRLRVEVEKLGVTGKVRATELMKT